MAKKETTTEEVENVFEGFKLLDQTPPPAAKTVAIKEVKDDELSEAEIEALNKSAERMAKKSNDENIDDHSKKDDNESNNTGGPTGESKESSKSQKSDKKDEVDPEEENGIAAYAKWASERGLLHLEENDTIESEEDLERIQANTIKKGIAQDREKLPEDGQKFLEFLDNGGKPSDFHKYYYGESSFEDFNIDTEENQVYAIREALKLESSVVTLEDGPFCLSLVSVNAPSLPLNSPTFLDSTILSNDLTSQLFLSRYAKTYLASSFLFESIW